MYKNPSIGDTIRLKITAAPFGGVAPGQTALVTEVRSRESFSINNRQGHCHPDYWDLVPAAPELPLPVTNNYDFMVGVTIRIQEGADYAKTRPGTLWVVTQIHDRWVTVRRPHNPSEVYHVLREDCIVTDISKEYLVNQVNLGLKALKVLSERYPGEFRPMLDEVRRAVS